MSENEQNIPNLQNIQQDSGIQIDVFELLRTLWKNILIIILVSVLCGALSFVRTLMFVSPKYSASATLYVNNSAISIGDSTFTISSKLSTTTQVDIYMLIINSRTTLEEVIEEANLSLSSSALRGMISTSALDASGAFKVTVTSGDPAQAELIANTIAKLIPDRIARIIDGSSVRVIDYAIIPTSRSSPNYVNETLLGLAIGAALSSALVIVIHLLRQANDVAVHSSDELKALYPSIPVLASIPDMRLSGKKGYYYSSYYESNKGEKK